jgi:hypothetical protein
MLVTEFRSFNGYALIVMVVFGMLAWRKMRNSWSLKAIDNPIFILSILCWTLGYVSSRFWLDWGMPAILAWMALEFQEVLNSKMSHFSWRRVLLAIALVGTLYLAITNDIGSRWTKSLNRVHLSLDKPEQASWLPEPGGIVYSDSMGIFYNTFFKNPHAPWRYILGFEPAMMTAEDLVIYRKIQRHFRKPYTFKPWAEKMRPEDRLIINHKRSIPPEIPGLEWHHTTDDIWIGRLPRGPKLNI